MALTDNLVSYWKFDEANGNAEDIHGPNDLTNNNTATFAAAKINNGCSLDGVNQCFTIADASQTGLDITGDISISFWWKPTSIVSGTPYYFCDKRKSSVNGQYSFAYSELGTGNSLNWYIRDSSNAASQGGTDDTGIITAGNWYHIVFCVDVSAPSATIYLNNVSKANTNTGSAATSIGNNDGQFLIGDAVAAGTVPANGIIDEFGIWSRLLTSDEVNSLYGGGDGLAYPLTPPTPPATTGTNNFLTLMGVGS